MAWTIQFCDAFEAEFDGLSVAVQDKAYAALGVLQQFGPTLSRPHVDTLEGSVYANMKELRFSVGNEVWRIVFAFDPDRKAILLAAGDKAGRNEGRFYRRLIATADRRFSEHLKGLT